MNREKKRFLSNNLTQKLKSNPSVQIFLTKENIICKGKWSKPGSVLKGASAVWLRNELSSCFLTDENAYRKTT